MMFRMKSLRLGNFRSILEMLGPDGHDDDEIARSRAAASRREARPMRGYRDGLDRATDERRERRYIPLERLARLYGDSRSETPTPPVWPADDAAIAAELRLASARTGEDLRRLRRSFAMRNHPDRVPAWLREEATRRMTIANALIDRAMHDRGKKPLVR
jgi:hypothetical protein